MHEQEPEQGRFDGLERAGHRLRVEGARAREHGIEVDPATGVGALGGARAAAAPAAAGLRRLAQLLEQDPILHARTAGQQLEVAVAADRVGDGAQRGHDSGHQPLTTLDGLRVVARGEGVCLAGSRSTRWAYFVAAPGFGPVRGLGIPTSGLYVVVAVLPDSPRARGLLNKLLNSAEFGGASVSDLYAAAQT